MQPSDTNNLFHLIWHIYIYIESRIWKCSTQEKKKRSLKSHKFSVIVNNAIKISIQQWPFTTILFVCDEISVKKHRTKRNVNALYPTASRAAKKNAMDYNNMWLNLNVTCIIKRFGKLLSAASVKAACYSIFRHNYLLIDLFNLFCI